MYEAVYLQGRQCLKFQIKYTQAIIKYKRVSQAIFFDYFGIWSL